MLQAGPQGAQLKGAPTQFVQTPTLHLLSEPLVSALDPRLVSPVPALLPANFYPCFLLKENG